MPDVTDAFLESLLSNISFAALFVVLFIWTLRSNDARERRYLSILDCYGKQLETIAKTLVEIQDRIERLAQGQ